MRKLLQVRARLTQAQAARLYFANPKLFTDQVIQRHVAGDDITATVAQSVVDVEFAFHRLDRFSFDQRQLSIGLRLVKRALPEKKASALHAIAPAWTACAHP